MINFIVCDNKRYTRNDRLPIGSSISPLLVNILIDNIEKQIYYNLKSETNINKQVEIAYCYNTN